MALISAAAFKTQTAAMATALTAAYKDSVETAVALEISDPRHPLRRVMKYFLFNPTTGVVTSNDAYIDSVYAGDAPIFGNELDTHTEFPVTLATATVEDAAPSDIVLTYNQAMRTSSVPAVGDYVTAGTQSYLVTVVAIVGAVVTLTVDTPYINGETITLTYIAALDPLTTTTGVVAPDFAAQVVTNNVV